VQHPQLGKLESEDGLLCGHLKLNDREISLRIDQQDATLDQVMSLAVAIASSLTNYDQISKDVIARDLLGTYNSGWNEYDDVQEDGTLKAVTNPQLDPVEFKERLVLYTVSISNDRCVDLWYEDGGLFWGHSILVQSLDGANERDFQAQLVG